MITLLQKLASKFASEKQNAETEWQSLVKKIAGDEANETEVTKVLRASGRSLDELETDVIREQRITELKAIAEQLADAVKSSEEAQAAHSSFLQRRLEVISKLGDENTVLVIAMQSAQAQADHCRAAEIELDLLLRDAA